AIGIGRGDLIADGIVGGTGGAAERGGDVGKVAQGVIGVGGGHAGRGGAGGDWRRDGDLAAQSVIRVGGLAAERVGLAREVAVTVVGVGGGGARGRRQIVADGFGRHSAVSVISVTHLRSDRIAG